MVDDDGADGFVEVFPEKTLEAGKGDLEDSQRTNFDGRPLVGQPSIHPASDAGLRNRLVRAEAVDLGDEVLGQKENQSQELPQQWQASLNCANSQSGRWGEYLYWEMGG